MKNIYVIVLLTFSLLLSSCGEKQTNDKKDIIQKGTDISDELKVSEIASVQQKSIKKNYDDLKELHPEIIKQYDDYNEKLANLSEEIGEINKDEFVKTLTKTMPYIVKYKEIKEKYPNSSSSKNYERFIIKNFKKDGIEMDSDKLLSLTSSDTYEKVFELNKKLENYILADGSIVSTDFKQSFEEFKKQDGNKNIDEQESLEEFRRVLVTDKAMIEGNCDMIEDDINRTYCESINKN